MHFLDRWIVIGRLPFNLCRKILGEITTRMTGIRTIVDFRAYARGVLVNLTKPK
jgi:hypothetical protein